MFEFQFLQFVAAVLFVVMYSYGETSDSSQAEIFKNIGLWGVAFLILNWFIILCPSVAVVRILLLLIIAAFAKLILWIIYKDKKLPAA